MMNHDAMVTVSAPGGTVPHAAPFVPTRLRRVAVLGARGGLAVADQALYAGAHFLLNILLARWLTPAEYGAFALVYSLFLLVAALYSAIVLEPMAVFGPGKYFTDRREYMGLLLRGHVAITVPAAAALLCGALLTGGSLSPATKNGLMVLGLTSPLLLLAWFTRRAFYLESRPGRAAAGSVIYFAFVLAGSFWLFRRQMLSPVTAILAMALASTVAATAQIGWLRPKWTGIRAASTDVVRDHWQYGRWALLSAAAMWFPLNVYYYVLPASAGLGEAGALKALLNLANPVLHTLVALGLLLTPSLVRRRDRAGLAAMHSTVLRTVGICAAGSALYLLFLWVLRLHLIDVLYGGRYTAYSSLPVMLAGALPVAASATVTFGSALRALEQPKRVFWSYAIFCVSAALCGVPIAAWWGLTGALAGMLLSYGTLVCAMVFFYYRALRAGAQGQPWIRTQTGSH